MRRLVVLTGLVLLATCAFAEEPTAPKMPAAPIPADEMVILRAENNLLRQQALRRDAGLAAERQRALAETLEREIGAAAAAAGLDPKAYVLDIDKRQWVPKPPAAKP